MSGWQNVQLGDMIEVKHGFAFEGQYFVDDGPFRLLTPGNFAERGGFVDRGDKQKQYNGPVPPDYLLTPGSLLVAMTEQAEGLLGSTAIVPRGKPCLHNQRLGLVLPRSEAEVDLRFLYCLFNTPQVRQQIRASASGVKVRHTSPSRIAAVKVSVPPLLEQRRIASILSAYDDLIEVNRRRVAILEAMARRLFEEWFVHLRFPGHQAVLLHDTPDGPLPEGWTPGLLGDLLTLHRGYDLSTADRQPGTIPVMTGSGRNGTHDTAKIAGPGVVTGRSGTVGRVFLVHEDFWPLNTALYVSAYKDSTPAFALFLLRRLDLQAHATGSAVPTLNRNHVHLLPTLRPPANLIQQFDRLAMPMLESIRVLERQSEGLAAARDLLLPRLLSGQLPTTAAHTPTLAVAAE